MLKRSIVIILFFGICCGAMAQSPDATAIKNNKIKKISSRMYSPGEPDTTVVTTYYNQYGDDTAYYENGSRRYYSVVGYNRKLQVLTINKYFPSGTLMDSTKFVYL